MIFEPPVIPEWQSDGRHLYRFVEQWLWNPGDPRLRQGDHGGQPQWRFDNHWFGVRVGLVALMAGGSAAKGSIPRVLSISIPHPALHKYIPHVFSFLWKEVLI